MKKNTCILLFSLLLVFPFIYSSAQITLPRIFSDNMILQQGKPIQIWGIANPSEELTVKLGKQNKKAKADKYGQWAVTFNPLKASKEALRLRVKGKNDSRVLDNILIGEVWLVSGQSNMEYSMNNHPKYAPPRRGDKNHLYNEYKAANNPMIRILYVEKNLKSDSLPTQGWKMINEESLAPISAIGYFFAKELVENIDTPVGIISSSWGGTPIESWTPEVAYLDSPFAENVLNGRMNNIKIGERYQKMIAPMAPFGLKGFLWYQGEQNLINGDRELYAKKQELLIHAWRSAWKDENLPFYYVQLAPYAYSQRRKDPFPKTWEELPYFWEVQTSCMSIPHTGMVVTTDLVDDVKDIHPSYKWIVGERLARWALANDYGKTDVIYSGPQFKSYTIADSNVILEFDNIGSGLTTSNKRSPNWFYAKDRSGRFGRVEAKLEDNKIVIPIEGLSTPISIRFGWDELAMPNLINAEGLPAIPFRIDNIH